MAPSPPGLIRPETPFDLPDGHCLALFVDPAAGVLTDAGVVSQERLHGGRIRTRGRRFPVSSRLWTLRRASHGSSPSRVDPSVNDRVNSRHLSYENRKPVLGLSHG
jgi:hypothetical protein